MKTDCRLVLCAALLMTTAGCMAMPFAQHPGTSQQQAQKFGSKRVVDKRAPGYLIADDMSECTVTEERFKSRIGDNVLCMWRAR